MDQHWGDDDWHHDGDADTTDLSGPDTPLSGAFDDHGGGFDGHPGADPSGGLDQPDLRDPHPDGADGGGYLADDPAGAFGHAPGHDPGHDSGGTGPGDLGHDDHGHDDHGHDPEGEI